MEPSGSSDLWHPQLALTPQTVAFFSLCYEKTQALSMLLCRLTHPICSVLPENLSKTGLGVESHIAGPESSAQIL